MKVRTLLLPVFAIYLLHLTEIRWVDLDNQTFNRLYPAAAYPEAIIPRFAGRLAFAGLAALFCIASFKNFARLPSVVLIAAAAACLSAIWSIDQARTLSELIDLLTLLGFVAAGLQYLGQRRLLTATWITLSAVLVVSSALAVVGDQHALMSGIHSGSWRGLFNHKNVFGSFAATLLVFTVLGRGLISAPRHSTAAVALVCLTALIFARSSTALAVAMSALTIGWFARAAFFRSPNNRLVAYCLIGLFGSVLAFVTIDYLDAAADLAGRDITLTGRTELWAAAMPLTLDRPFGWGFGTMGGESVINAMIAKSGWAYARSTHSSYIQMALDLGWPFALLIGGWLMMLMCALRPASKGSVAPLAAGLAAALFIGGITEINSGFYASASLFLVIVAATALKAERTFNQLYVEGWLGKYEQRDKWIFSLTTASMAANRGDHDETTPPQPHSGVQGKGGPSGAQG